MQFSLCVGLLMRHTMVKYNRCLLAAGHLPPYILVNFAYFKPRS
jgi:hypothetical protein